MRPTYRWRPFVGKPLSLQPLGYINLLLQSQGNPTLLFGDSMEDQMRSLETKEKLQKALEPERPTHKKTWTPSSQKRHQPYGKGAPKEANKKLERFLQTICKCRHHFGETGLLQEVVHQTMKVPFTSANRLPLYPKLYTCVLLGGGGGGDKQLLVLWSPLRGLL